MQPKLEDPQSLAARPGADADGQAFESIRPPVFKSAPAIVGGIEGLYLGPNLKLQLDYLEAELGKSEWFSGNELTAADEESELEPARRKKKFYN